MRPTHVALAVLLAAAPVALAEVSLLWELPRCAMVVGIVDLDPERVRAAIPEGFEPASWGALGQAKALVEFAECADVAYGNWEILVVPPTHLQRDDAQGYYVKFDTLVQDDFTRHALAAWGLPVHDGFARVRETNLPGLHEAELQLDDVGRFTLTFTLTGAPPPPTDFPFLEFTPADRGTLVTWDARLDDLSLAQGVGTLTLPEKSGLAELAGATELPAEILAGGWTRLHGNVRAPSPEPAATGDGGRSAWQGAAFVGLALVGGALAWRAWVVAVSAYTRLTARDTSAHPRRARILALVAKHPGITPAELRAATGFAPGVAAHHLALLERHRAVVRERDGARARLYLPNAARVSRLPPARARALAAIRAHPGVGQAELAAMLGVSRWALAYHARQLERAGAIRIVRAGRGLRYVAR